jgi:hypothetical protein
MPVYIYLLPTEPSGLRKHRLFLWAENEKIPVGEFLNDLRKSRPRDAIKLVSLFDKAAGLERITNPEHFKDIEGHKPLWEFKAHGVRIYCFFDGPDIILVEGDFKKSDKSSASNRQAIARAEQRAHLYQEEKKANRVEVRK